jgi:hypothetical protein
VVPTAVQRCNAERRTPNADVELVGAFAIAGRQDHVTEADIRAGLTRLNSRSPRFAVLRIRPHYYIQTYALHDGRLDVDYRDGGPTPTSARSRRPRTRSPTRSSAT